MSLKDGYGRFLLGTAWALLRRPDLWRTAAAMVPPKWWSHYPYLPVPPTDYVRFRVETMYGADANLGGGDLIEYLEWCRRMRSRAR